MGLLNKLGGSLVTNLILLRNPDTRKQLSQTVQLWRALERYRATLVSSAPERSSGVSNGRMDSDHRETFHSVPLSQLCLMAVVQTVRSKRRIPEPGTKSVKRYGACQ